MELAQLWRMNEKPATAPDDLRESVAPSPSSTIQVRNVAFTLLAMAIVIGLLRFMQPVLIPFLLAALLFYALDPAVDWVQQRRVPRAIGGALILLMVVSGCGSLTYLLQGQALTVIDQLPAGARKLAASLRKTPGAKPGAIEKVQQAADALQETEKARAAPGITRVQVEERGFQASTLVWSSSIGLLSAANQLVMVLFLTYFMLLSISCSAKAGENRRHVLGEEDDRDGAGRHRHAD